MLINSNNFLFIIKGFSRGEQKGKRGKKVVEKRDGLLKEENDRIEKGSRNGKGRYKERKIPGKA